MLYNGLQTLSHILETIRKFGAQFWQQPKSLSVSCGCYGGMSEVRRESPRMSQHMSLAEPFDLCMLQLPQLLNGEATGVPRKGPSMYKLLCSNPERW